MIAIAHVRHAQPIRVEVVERERELAPPEPHDAQPVRPAEVALGIDEAAERAPAVQRLGDRKRVVLGEQRARARVVEHDPHVLVEVHQLRARRRDRRERLKRRVVRGRARERARLLALLLGEPQPDERDLAVTTCSRKDGYRNHYDVTRLLGEPQPDERDLRALRRARRRELGLRARARAAARRHPPAVRVVQLEARARVHDLVRLHDRVVDLAVARRRAVGALTALAAAAVVVVVVRAARDALPQQ